MIESAEVFDAKAAPAGALSATRWNVSILSGMLSGIASITRSTPSTASERSVVIASPDLAVSATSASTLPRETPLSRLRWIVASAASSWDCSVSYSLVAKPPQRTEITLCD